MQANVLCESRVFHAVLWRHKCCVQNLGRENALKDFCFWKSSLSSFCLCSPYWPSTCACGWDERITIADAILAKYTLNIFKSAPLNTFFCDQLVVLLDKVWPYAVLYLCIHPNFPCRPWLWYYCPLWRMLGSGGWNTRSPWAIFALQTTITRFCISNWCNTWFKLVKDFVIIREALSPQGTWHVYWRRVRKGALGLTFLDNFCDTGTRWCWHLEPPHQENTQVVTLFCISDWVGARARVLCSGRQSKGFAGEIRSGCYSKNQGGIEGGIGQHFTQDCCGSPCFWRPSTCCTC